MTLAETRASAEMRRQHPDLTPERLLHMLREMLVIRRVEEMAQRLYQQGKIAGFLHLYIGQEGVAVGVNEALRADDHIITTYRDHGFALMRGCSPTSVIGELMGREVGCARGRGGSMHMYNKERNFHGGHGIVGAHVPLGAGIAFSEKYKGSDRVCICLLGDGAVPNGGFHEAANMAGIWGLPLILCVENNMYAMGTPLERSQATLDIHKRAASYNMHDILIVDGLNVEDVYEGIKAAAEHARKNEPVLIEIRTYRFRGHSVSDPASYRTKEELDAKKALDPIKRLAAKLEEMAVLSGDEFKAMDKEVRAEVNDATAEAEKSPTPDPATVHDYVVSQPLIPGKGSY
jgi:pyruvate dehydrogenase E1 component alpha subunit